MPSLQQFSVYEMTDNEFKHRVLEFFDPREFSKNTPAKWKAFLREVLEIPNAKLRKERIRQIKVAVQIMLSSKLLNPDENDVGVIMRLYKLLPEKEFRALYQEVLQKTKPPSHQKQKATLFSMIKKVFPVRKTDLNKKFQKDLAQFVNNV